MKIVRITEILHINDYSLYCLFSNKEVRLLDFKSNFNEWKVKESDIEYSLYSDVNKFKQFSLKNGTLSWDFIGVSSIDNEGNKVFYPYEIDPSVLYEMGKIDIMCVIMSKFQNEKCRKIVSYIYKHEDTKTHDILYKLDIPESTLYYNLRILKDANLIETNQKGVYSMNSATASVIQNSHIYDLIEE